MPPSRELRMLVAAAGRKKPPKRLPRPRYPWAQEKALGNAWIAAYRAWFKAITADLLAQLPTLALGVEGARLDGLEDMRRFFELARGRWRAAAARLGTITSGLLNEIAAFNLQQTRQQLEAGLGVSPLVGEPWLVEETRTAAQEAARLVVGIGDQAADSLERTVTDGVRQGRSTKAIAADVAEQLGVGERRARNIARDQAGKWNGRLSQIRQQKIGVERYTWRNSQDRRVRGNPNGLYPNARHNHWTREGQVYSWSEPPADGNPGQPILCRCTAEPVLDAFFEGLDDFQGPFGALNL